MMLLRTIDALWSGFLAIWGLCDTDTITDAGCHEQVRGDGE